MAITLSLPWLEAVMLAGVRITAFLMIAPPFSYRAIPARIKAMLAIGLALAVSPRVTQGFVSPDTGALIIALIIEVAVGAVLGFLVMLVFAAVQSAGALIDLFGGFQIAQAFDPQSMVEGAQFARLFQIAALALLFASDGYQLVIGGFVRSFTAWPVASGIDVTSSASAAVTGVTQMFLAGVQIAGPLVVVLFLADLGLGLLSRVAPALNAFVIGFPVKILLTLTLAVIVFVALPRIVASLAGQAVELLTGAG